MIVLSAFVLALLAAAPPSIEGEWLLTNDYFGNDYSTRLVLEVKGQAVSGTLARPGRKLPVKGTVQGIALRFEVEDGSEKSAYAGQLVDGRLEGTVLLTGGDSPAKEPPHRWQARRFAADKPAAPRVHDFEPKEFHRVFSASIPPVLRVWPGDTIRSRTVDAGGVDERDQARVLGGNPQTGPFYVEGAMPGDTLVVQVKKLRLNRSWAVSDDAFVSRALTPGYAEDHKQEWKDVYWTLDLAAGTARPTKPSERLKGLVVPVKPMLGCVGVAPGFGGAPVRTADSGRFGGNMDFNEVVEGSTVYLPVAQPGALLYFGDGHALQGDGELNGNALETSLAVEVTVDLVKEKRIGTPRVENATHVMAMGLGGSLDDAFREATSELAAWVEKDYGLSGAEAAILLGATIEYEISEVADRNAGVVAKVAKRYLPAPKKN